MTSVASLSADARQQSPKSPTSATAGHNSPPAQGQSDERIALQATLADLQTKRLNALRLYQEEKSRRASETKRADGLATQLRSLALDCKPASHAEKGSMPSSTIQTDFFVAEVRSLGLAQGGPSASLTWHCLAMADLLACPSQIVVVTEARESRDDVKGYRVRSVGDRGVGTSDPPRECDEEVGTETTSGGEEEDTEALKIRLQQAENAAEEAKRSSQRSEKLIADLKTQLGASTAACKDLLETVKEQEDAIEKLS